MASQLVPLDSGPPIPLEKPIVFVGRHPDCDVCITSRKMSRRHCCIAQAHGELIIRDLGSTNGVRINGRRVKEATVRPNDVVTIAHLRYKYISDEDTDREEQDEEPTD